MIHVRRTAALGSIVAAFAVTAGLSGWMMAKVAEYPGVPREVGALPPWFTGALGPVRGAPAVAPAAAGATVSNAKVVEFADGTVEIALSEYEMKPDRIHVPPGKVTFVLHNRGRYAHDFHVEGPGVEAYAAKFGPGRTVRLEVELPAGEFKISCPLSNHNERGMHGELLVSAQRAGK